MIAKDADGPEAAELRREAVVVRRSCHATYTTRIFVAHPIVSAVICGLVYCAFLPSKSDSATPRAAAQAFQT